MPGEYGPGVLQAEVALQHGFCQISQCAEYDHDQCNGHPVHQIQHREKPQEIFWKDITALR